MKIPSPRALLAYCKDAEKFPFLLLCIAAALLLCQHWGMTYSNSDDPNITRFTWAQVLEAASGQGRFWLVPISCTS